MGLEPVLGVDCIFVNFFIILFFFVNDIITMYSRQHIRKADELQTKMFEAYEMRYLGEVQ